MIELVEDVGMLKQIVPHLARVGTLLEKQARLHSVPRTVQAIAQARSLVAHAAMLLEDEVNRVERQYGEAKI